MDGRVAGMMLGYRLAAEGDTPKLAGLCQSLKPLSPLAGRHEASFYVNTLAIYPEARNHGLGAELLEAAVRKARKAHCARVLMEVSAENDRALRFYERHGFACWRSAAVATPAGEVKIAVLEKIVATSPACG